MRAPPRAPGGSTTPPSTCGGKTGAWTVLSAGTAFDRSFYRREGIPAGLQLETATPAVAAQARSITLSRKPGNRAIGVEPQGGRFSAVLQPGDTTTRSYTFSTYGKNQTDSILSIYATDASRIPLDRPLARVRLSGLKAGETERRIRVDMTRQPDGRLNIAASDLKYRTELAISQLDDRDLRAAQLRLPAETGTSTRSNTPLQPNLPRIALGGAAVPANSPGALGRYIGVRRAGGIFSPVLLPSDTPESTANKPRLTYFSTSMPGQRTADVQLFAGDSPYIELTKPFARYIVSGIKPSARASQPIRLEFTVGPRGTIIPSATNAATGDRLQIDKYSSATLARLRDSGQVSDFTPGSNDAMPGRIPADPAR